MSALHPADAFELLRFLQPFHQRLVAAQDPLSRRQKAEREKGWLKDATALIEVHLGQHADVLERARALPELQGAIEELAEEDQGRWVDTLEKLVAGITFHASSRSPLIESLLPHQKWPALRRAGKDEVAKYAKEFERRKGSGYVTRMLGQPEFAFIGPVLEQVQAAFTKWQECFSPRELPTEEAEGIRKALVDAAEDVEVALRQAKLLSEAALLRWSGAFEEAGLQAKPRKRSGKLEPRPPTSAAAEVVSPAEVAAVDADGANAEVAAPAAGGAGAAAVSDAAAEGVEVAPMGSEVAPTGESAAAPAPAPAGKKKRAAKKPDPQA